MSRRRKRRTNKSNRAVTADENVLDNLDRIQNRLKGETKTVSRQWKKKRSNASKITIAIAILVVSSLSIGLLLPGNVAPDTNNNNTDQSPVDNLNLVFQDLNRNTFDLWRYSGSHIIIDVMGTSCEPCKTQVEILKDFKNAYPHVVIVSVSTDDIASLSEFKTSHSITWDTLRDVNGVSVRLQIAYIPTLIHISPGYEEINRNVGVTSVETLGSWVS